jgi:hypothetical protein
MVASHANAHGMHAVQTAAVKVVRLLGNGSQQPLPGYAQAVLDLSEALDRALARLRA